MTKKKVPENTLSFPIAGIGASAGGLDAFKALVKSIPENSGIAWILVQHQLPTFESKLKGLLQKLTPLQVVEITTDLSIEPNIIYIAPPNKRVTVKAGKFKLTPRPVKSKNDSSHSIDLFFISLAAAFESNAIGVVLSGTATDGTIGLKAIKDQGGITFAQNIASAAYPGMPGSAIDAGVVDFVLPAEKIPKKMLEIKKLLNTHASKRRSDVKEEQEEKTYKEILAILHHYKGMDFTYYKQSTIRRRILRRMVLNKFKKIADYAKHLRENKAEALALYQDMLIPVTSFFRDAKVFDNLCENVFPNLVKHKSTEGFIRIWVAGCSTGEEAYSIAICFKEYLGIKKEKIQIFATDLSEPAIIKARAGIYSKADAEVVSNHRLKQYFNYTNGAYQVKKELRDMCVFAVHNFLKDPPFSKIDFISCRNVLIYMDTYLQKKALSTFHYALNPKGLLMLGKSENTIGVSDLFIPTSKVDKVFVRKNVPSRISPFTSKTIENKNWSENKVLSLQPLITDFQKSADDLLLARYTPATVVVNDVLEIVYFRGKTSNFLQQSSGKPTHNLLKLAREGLAFELRNIFHKAKKTKKAVRKENIPLVRLKKNILISIEVIPLAHTIEPYWVIIFEEHPLKEIALLKSKGSLKNVSNNDILRFHHLEDELLQMREDMRSISEEQEANNDELQSTNEELLSSNEELQSLNEELETSKEELQSTVEELTVVNQEMINLNEQLATEKEYAEAIIATIPQSMLVLDKNFRVVVANQQFYETFAESDINTSGKIVYDIGNRQWDIPELRVLLESILPEKKSIHGFEVEHSFQHIGHRVMRFNAREIVKDAGDKLILLSIEDITDVKKAARKIEESEHRYANMVFSSPSMIAILEGESMVIKIANDAILETWGKGKNIIGKSLFEVLPEIIDQGFKDILLQVYKTGVPYKAFQQPVYIIRQGKKELTYYTFIYQAQKDSHGNITGVAIIATDVTSEAALHEKVRQSEEKFQAAVSAVEGIVWTNNAKGEMEGEQPGWSSLTGQTYKEYQGFGWAKAVHPDDAQPTIDAWNEAVKNNSDFIFEHRVKVKDNTWRQFSIRAIPLINEDGKVREWVGVHTDITEKRKAEIHIKESEEKFRTMAESSDILIGVNNETVDAVYFNKTWEKLTGRPVEDLMNLGWADLLHPEDKEPFLNKFFTAFKNKQSYDGEFRMLNKEGTYSWLYAKVQVRLHPDGSYAGHISSCIDITQRKENEQALKESEEQFSTLADNMENLAWMADGEGTIYWYNKRWYEYTGTTLDEMYGWGWQKVHHPDHIDRVLEFVKKAWLVNVPFELTFPLKGADGNYKWFLTRAFPISNSEGKVIRWIGTNTNIDEQKKEEDQFRILADQAPMWVWLTDTEINVLYANPELLNFIGIDHYRNFTGHIWEQKVHPEDISKVYQSFEVAVRLHAPFALEFRVLNSATNSYEWFHVKGVPRYDGDTFSGFIGTGINIHENKLTLSQLEYRKALLEAHNEASLDGILLVDTNGKILSYNHRFIEIWEMPAHLAEKKDDNEALSFALTQLVNPDKFIEKVKWLYDHPKEISFDELEFKNGKIVERYGYPITAPDGTYYAWSWIFRDITKEKKAERAIRDSEKKLRKTTEHLEIATTAAEVGTWSFDLTTYVLEWSPLHKKMWGYDENRTDLKYEDWHNIIFPGDKEAAFAEVEKALINKSVYEATYRIKKADTMEVKWIRSIGRYFYNDEGEPITLTGISIDITQQKNVENQLRESEKYFRYLTDTVPTIIWITEPDGYCSYLNKTWYEYTGQTEEEGVGFGWLTATHPDDAIGAGEAFVKANEEQKPFTYIYRLRTKDGTYRWAKDSGSPRFNSDGKYEGMIGTVVDVHEETIATGLIMVSEKRFRLLADTMPQLVWTADADGNVNYYNQSVFEYSGLSLEQLQQDGWLSIVHPEERAENIKRWLDSIQNGNEYIFEHRLKRFDGEYRWQLSRALPQRDANGNITMWVGASTDIQNLKEEEQRKSDFIKMVSHELKTPVTSIKGYVQLLLHMLDEDEKIEVSGLPLKNSLNRIDKQVVRLTRLITEMLDLSRIETGKLDMKKELFSINELVTESVQDISHTNSVHTINVQHDHQGRVMGDKDRIQQVLINFITNSIKYSPDNHIIEVKVFSPDDKHISVSVKDYGIGINKEDHQKIFERFYRAKGKNGHNISGFGIGLFIANEIIQRHNGHITVESEEGYGSVFTFTLPLFS